MVTGRLHRRRLAWVAGVLLVATAAMLWMAAHRVPHPGSPVAAHLAALRGLWPASLRRPAVVVAALALVVAVDAVFVVLIATGRGRRLALPARASLGALAALVILQGLHQTEHLVQVTQLLVTGGNADLSQGVLTRLNQELVHLSSDFHTPGNASATGTTAGCGSPSRSPASTTSSTSTSTPSPSTRRSRSTAGSTGSSPRGACSAARCSGRTCTSSTTCSSSSRSSPRSSTSSPPAPAVLSGRRGR